jgi:cyanophycin synthetase
LVAVSGTNGKTLVAGLLADMLRAAGRTVGHTSSDGLRVGDRQLATGDRCSADSVRRALMNPYADSFVFEISEPNVIDEGMLFDRCEVAVVTNLGSGDHLGKKYVDELVTIAKAVRAPVDVVLPTGYAVLNADDPAVLDMAKHTKGKVLLYSREAHSSPVREHLQAEGRAVVRDGDRILSCRGTQRELILDLAGLRCPVLGLPSFLVDDLLAAVAGAVALGLGPEPIARGLAASIDQGGVAVFDLPTSAARPFGGLLILTPSRNPSALEAWSAHFRDAFPGRKVGVLLDPSADWRMSDAPALNELLAQCFSEVTIALNSDAGSSVENLQMVRPGLNTRPLGQSADFVGSLDQLLEGHGNADLLCVCPSNAAGFSKVLGHLDAKGVTRRRVGGLASVRHCR